PKAQRGTTAPLLQAAPRPKEERSFHRGHPSDLRLFRSLTTRLSPHRSSCAQHRRGSTVRTRARRAIPTQTRLPPYVHEFRQLKAREFSPEEVLPLRVPESRSRRAAA